MTTLRLTGLSTMLFAASMSSGHAGPCSSQIEQMAVRVEARLEAQAGAGSGAAESTAARLHRQPTPRSIAAAEEALGELSGETIERVRSAMTRARAADDAGDQKACDEALAEVQRAIGP
jgi:hypothetical protein